jgi:hypothetical protein
MSRARVAGMPSNKALRRQALQLASGGVQSKRSITRQYTRAQGDTAGFTSALVSLLKGEQGTAGAAYGQAVSQQQQIDQAARQQLGNLGEDYGGAAVKVGATGDNAISGLLAGQAAASDYASRQPGIAAGRGALAQTGLQNALEDALNQRADAIHQAYGPAYASVRQNAFNEAMALQNLGLQKQQLALSQQGQFFSESEQLKHDRQQNQQFQQEMIARYGYDPTRGKFLQGSSQAGSTIQGLAHQYGLTPNEIIGLQGHTVTQVQSLLAQGTNWRSAIRQAEANGVPPEIARFAVMSVYSNPPKPPGRPDLPIPSPTGTVHYKGKTYDATAFGQWQQADAHWKANMAAFNRALKGFKVQVIFRQLQRKYDSVMHPPRTSTEH